MRRNGFTLIELLVVIAIIGILSSVVLASLSMARDKGADSTIKANLSNARTEAALYYDNNRNYSSVCVNSSTVGAIGDSVQAAAQTAGLSSFSRDAIGSTSSAVCNDNSTAWAAQVMLKSSTGVFCVDSSGRAVTSATNLLTSTGDVNCT